MHSSITVTTTQIQPPPPPGTTPRPADPDVALLERYFAGDTRSGDRLFARHARSIRRYFLNKVRRDADVDDLVHEVLRRMFDPKEGFLRAVSFGAYLFGVQRNILRHYYRMPLDAEPGSSVADSGAATSTWIERQERCQQLLVALRRLPIPQQEVLELHYWEGLTNPKIAECLAVPVGTVAGRLRLAKEKLLGTMGLPIDTPARGEAAMQALDAWALQVAANVRTGRPVKTA